MKLILQHGAQTIEHEFVAGDGQALTNQQATRLIEYAFAAYDGPKSLPGDATLAQKAGFVLRVLTNHMTHAAKQQRRQEIQATNEAQIRSELG